MGGEGEEAANITVSDEGRGKSCVCVFFVCLCYLRNHRVERNYIDDFVGIVCKMNYAALAFSCFCAVLKCEIPYAKINHTHKHMGSFSGKLDVFWQTFLPPREQKQEIYSS